MKEYKWENRGMPAGDYGKNITLLKVGVYAPSLLMVNWERNLHWQNGTSRCFRSEN